MGVMIISFAVNNLAIKHALPVYAGAIITVFDIISIITVGTEAETQRAWRRQ